MVGTGPLYRPGRRHGDPASLFKTDALQSISITTLVNPFRSAGWAFYRINSLIFFILFLLDLEVDFGIHLVMLGTSTRRIHPSDPGRQRPQLKASGLRSPSSVGSFTSVGLLRPRPTAILPGVVSTSQDLTWGKRGVHREARVPVSQARLLPTEG